MIRRYMISGALVGGAGLTLLAACADPVTPGPRANFAVPSGVMPGLDISQRLPESGQWGGDAAFANLAAAYPNAASSSEPLMQTIAWWQEHIAKSSSKKHGATLNYSTETAGGDYFIIEGEDVYAPEGRQAKITNASMTAGRMGNDAPINIYVAFKFEGSKASNNSLWTITEFGETEPIINHPIGSFGSASGSGVSRAWAGQSTEGTSLCNVMVKGTSYHEAWFDGKWSTTGGSIGVNPNQVSATINMTPEKTGTVNATSVLKTHYDCPPPPPGGGGGYGGDECTIYQQWFFYDDDGVRIEWWEPEPGSPSECQEWEI